MTDLSFDNLLIVAAIGLFLYRIAFQPLATGLWYFAASWAGNAAAQRYLTS